MLCVVSLWLPQAASAAITCPVCAILAYCTIIDNYMSLPSLCGHIQSGYASCLSYL